MPATGDEIESARRRLMAWILWYLKTHPTECPSQAELARQLGISPSAISAWFTTGSTRLPALDVLLSLRKVTGLPLDVLLDVNPPEETPSDKR